MHTVNVKLTVRERFLIDRRRRGLSQRAYARKIARASLFVFRRWENGFDRPGEFAVPQVGALATHEKCFLLRKRRGLSSGEFAARLGVTLNWLSEIEHGKQPVKRVAQYWKRRGCLRRTG